MKYFVLALAAFVLASASAQAASYKVDAAQSKISFAGEHAGTAFKGQFEKWTAAIEFDAANLPASRIDVTVETASAKTGNAMYDGTLPSADWFASDRFPQARFISTAITQNADGSYLAKGNLTIRDVTKPVEFTFTLSPPDASTPAVNADAKFSLERLAFGIGQESDPKAEWVSANIALELHVVASK